MTKKLVTFTPMFGVKGEPISLIEALELCGEFDKTRARYVRRQLNAWGFCHTGGGHNVGSIKGTINDLPRPK